MKIGYFCNPTNLGHARDYAEVMDEARTLAVFCDQNGFDSIWFAEHHFSLWGREVLPNPIIFATDIAARTERIRIGLAAAIITFWHPLRLAEDVALLDQLCDGRLELGVGRGNYGLEGLNLNPMADPRKPEENYLVFEDTLHILKKAFSRPLFNHKGAKYTVPTPGFNWDRAHPVDHADYIDPQTKELINLSVYPRPKQQPYPPLWQVVDSPGSVAFAAKNDLGIIMWRPPVSTLKERFRLYRETAAKASGKPAAFGARTGVVRDTFVAGTMDEAREIAGEYIVKSYNWYNWRGPSIFLGAEEKLSEAEEAALKKELTYEFVHPRSLLFGTPDYVLEKLHELDRELAIEQVLINCSFSDIGHEHTMRSMRLFADEVLPYAPRGARAAGERTATAGA